MDCSPLNLAHFHERRAEKFMKHHRYDDASKAVQTSLIYLQDAYNHVTLPKSIEVLDTHKWEYERKLRQIQMRKQQHESKPRVHIMDESDEMISLQPLELPTFEFNVSSISPSLATIAELTESFQK